MKRTVLIAVLVVLVTLVLGAAALAASGALDQPDLSRVDPSGGGGIAQNVQ